MVFLENQQNFECVAILMAVLTVNTNQLEWNGVINIIIYINFDSTKGICKLWTLNMISRVQSGNFILGQFRNSPIKRKRFYET